MDESDSFKDKLKKRIKQYKKSILAIISIGLFIFSEKDTILISIKEYFAPNISMSIVPEKDFQKHGAASYRYEYLLDGAKGVQHINNDYDIKHLSNGVPISRFSCNNKLSDLYRLTIIIQNTGGNTAKNFKLSTWFSSVEDNRPVDPYVRIIHADSDGLSVPYLYQHLSEREINELLPSCIRDGIESKKEFPKRKFDLIKSTYHDLGLTRDVAIFEGTLEAHLLQNVVFLIQIPHDISKFAVIMDLECPDCKFSFKTATYGQLVVME